ncbi:MAG: NAD(P)-dependent oxidoreductase [Proteobacteria bacterium]|nr:NAD(P)-dependent oxidoreductase [Pseudomonadota bacterium]NDC23177.1 NAD(P)-dependent oxidoreductase [Pseudomonadota bacterium]NDD03352.1 NAD(P)-dependent oxidoreductase [Pseudomonadota bacterium]NDG28059.1 NAD(P)-dependent oxidoreductase [Pseudomonadota bacterium]
MKILITGASGFVGRNLLLRVASDPSYSEIIIPIRNRDKLKKQGLMDGLDFKSSRFRIVETAAPQWENLQDVKVDHLIHCAGLLFAREKREFLETNVNGTLNLFRNTSFERAIVLSSQAASGPCEPGQVAKTERDGNVPVTWYGRSKLEMEKRLQKEFGNRNYVCLRPPIILGARDSATLPLFKMVKGRILFKPGLKLKYYSYIAVNDLVDAILKTLKAPLSYSELSLKEYFVACDEVITDEALITTAALAADKRGVLLRVPQTLLKGIAKAVDAVPSWREAIPSLSGDRAQEIWPDRWVVSSQKFAEQFAWKSSPDLLQTLKETHNWYKETGQI